MKSLVDALPVNGAAKGQPRLLAKARFVLGEELVSLHSSVFLDELFPS